MLEDLQKILDSCIKNAYRLLKMSSTQGNESFNNIVASKSPKIRICGGLESTAFRVPAVVSQKNIGHGALSNFCLFLYLLFIFHSYLHVSIKFYTSAGFSFSLFMFFIFWVSGKPIYITWKAYITVSCTCWRQTCIYQERQIQHCLQKTPLWTQVFMD